MAALNQSIPGNAKAKGSSKQQQREKPETNETEAQLAAER